MDEIYGETTLRLGGETVKHVHPPNRLHQIVVTIEETTSERFKDDPDYEEIMLVLYARIAKRLSQLSERYMKKSMGIEHAFHKDDVLGKSYRHISDCIDEMMARGWWDE